MTTVFAFLFVLSLAACRCFLNHKMLKPCHFKLSGWMTVSSLLVPLVGGILMSGSIDSDSIIWTAYWQSAFLGVAFGLFLWSLYPDPNAMPAKAVKIEKEG